MNQDQASFQSLFDDIMNEKDQQDKETQQIAADKATPVVVTEKAPPPSVPPAVASTSPQHDGGEEDLENLFDRVFEEKWGTPSETDTGTPLNTVSTVSVPSAELSETQIASSKDIYHHVGEAARRINTLMRELGVDQFFKNTAAHVMPSTRERLSFVVEEMENASKQVLALSEQSTEALQSLQSANRTLNTRWQDLFQGKIPVAQFEALCRDTHSVLQSQSAQYEKLMSSMSDMVISQSFQDLTGQVLHKVIRVSHELEKQLLSFLLDNIPPEIRGEGPLAEKQFLQGPNLKKNKTSSEQTAVAVQKRQENLEEILTSQEEVDALLESLGF